MMSSYGWLIDATITSTVVAIIIVVVRLLLKENLTGKLKYYLWIIFLLRLMVIPLPESPISIYNLMPEKKIIQEQDNLNNILTTNDTISSNTESYNNDNIDSSSDYNNLSLEEEKLKVDDIFFVIYISMLVLFIIVPVTNYIIFVCKSKRNSKEVKIEYLKRLREIKRRLNIRRKITLVYGDTAFIYGFFKVKLVIPEGITLEELDAVLVHELIHYKYGDLLINWLLMILKAIYWFNPIVWLVFRQIRKDCEVACDERVIESKFVDKKTYATVLFKNALKGNRYLVGTSSFSKQGSDIKGRIKMIQKFNKKSTIFIILGMVMFLLLGVICLTNSVSALNNSPNISVNDNDELNEKASVNDKDTVNDKDKLDEKTNDNNYNDSSENNQTEGNLNTEVSSNNAEITNNDISSNSYTNLNDMVINVKDYILNGQGDKPEALKLKWSKTFLEQVDFKTMYDNYLAEGGNSDDIEAFAKYITLYAPIQSNWEELFKKDLYDIYGENLVRVEQLEGDSYQAYINVDGKEVPYVVVSSRTGYFHG